MAPFDRSHMTFLLMFSSNYGSILHRCWHIFDFEKHCDLEIRISGPSRSSILNWYHSIACLYWHPIVTLSLMQCKFAILQLRAIPAEALSPEHWGCNLYCVVAPIVVTGLGSVMVRDDVIILIIACCCRSAAAQQLQKYTRFYLFTHPRMRVCLENCSLGVALRISATSLHRWKLVRVFVLPCSERERELY